MGQSCRGVTSPKGLFWVKIISFIKKIAKVHPNCFELGENVAMVLFIGYYCNFPLQKCCQLRWSYLGMLTIMVPLQN
jgi:hypothetical protein